MRVHLQRVSEAYVDVDNERISRIGPGLLLLVGIRDGDTSAEADWLATKVAGLRLFEDEAGKFNLSLNDVSGEALVVSQFTLYGDARKGRRPSFTDAASPEIADELVDYFAEKLRAEGVPVQQGRFGAKMKVGLINDGPVTLLLERTPAS